MGLQSPHGLLGFVISTLKGVSYREIMWEIPWNVSQKMVADMPRQTKKKNIDKNRELTPETAADFRKHIELLNSKISK